MPAHDGTVLHFRLQRSANKLTLEMIGNGSAVMQAAAPCPLPTVAAQPPDKEGGMMADSELFRLNPEWSLGFDRAQWIVRKKAGTKGRWNPVSFVGSHKAILWRVLGENGVVVTPEAKAAIDAMPHRFLDWLAERDAGAADADEVPAQKAA